MTKFLYLISSYIILSLLGVPYLSECQGVNVIIKFRCGQRSRNNSHGDESKSNNPRVVWLKGDIPQSLSQRLQPHLFGHKKSPGCRRLLRKGYQNVNFICFDKGPLLLLLPKLQSGNFGRKYSRNLRICFEWNVTTRKEIKRQPGFDEIWIEEGSLSLLLYHTIESGPTSISVDSREIICLQTSVLSQLNYSKQNLQICTFSFLHSLGFLGHN